MTISIGSDHAALDLKNELRNYLENAGYLVIDRGTYTKESCDYPDYGHAVAVDVRDHIADRGIVICATGIGMSIVANKVKNVRCALVDNVEFARLTREHNDTNVLALGAKAVNEDLAKQIVAAWLETPFSNEERHQRRIDKITKYEENSL
ncbi:MAG: ribose 5-phosphate isomerase B [Clostridium sp.]|nr:MAG: ribose 5-phosphate isomerase B [Clostridium sp.]